MNPSAAVIAYDPVTSGAVQCKGTVTGIMTRSSPGGGITVISELQSRTHGFEKINTENAGHSIVIDDSRQVMIYGGLNDICNEQVAVR